MTPILKNKSDIVLGYRFENNVEMPSYRKFGNKMLDKFTNMASDMPFRDTQSGFRAYSRKAIEKINFSSNGFGADSEILINASNKQLIISEEKIEKYESKLQEIQNEISQINDDITVLENDEGQVESFRRCGRRQL